jgi:hypothetical protein
MMKDEKMMIELVKELSKAGIKKEQVDDYMFWGVMKLMLGIMKIKWSLEESGIKGIEAKKKLDKIIAMVAEKSADELHEMVHKGKKGGKEEWM